MYYKVMSGSECYGNGTLEQCNNIVRMQKSKIGNKEHKAMRDLNLIIDENARAKNRAQENDDLLTP